MKKCCFVGSNDIHDKDELFAMLVGRIENVIENGDVGEFWVEDCNCFDEICISALRHVKEKNKQVRICLIVPKTDEMKKCMGDYDDVIVADVSDDNQTEQICAFVDRQTDFSIVYVRTPERGEVVIIRNHK